MGERYNYNWNVGHWGPSVSKKNCNSTCPVKSVIDYSVLLYPILFNTTSTSLLFREYTRLGKSRVKYNRLTSLV